MQVVKGDQNGYPVPGGIAGPPCTGGYKYSGLVLQVVGWATGRQPVTVKKLNVKKLNFGLRNVSLTEIDLGSEKRIYELWKCVQTDINKCKIIYWKERSKYRADWGSPLRR
jgi:hypothetical protein